ncbi:MAG: hypothetical protein ACRD68_16200, partial [Pyrinomonadaceae bacterium]
ADATGEINKRAGRLKVHLLLHVPEGEGREQKAETELDQEGVKGALVTLCNQIISFVENPVLKSPGTVDVKQSARAGRELQNIIGLSGSISRSAGRLSGKSK